MNVDTMRLLVAKGLSAQDILEIAETMDAPKGRSAAAERQARYRARVKADCDGDDVTRDVTRDGDSVTDAPLSLPPNEINSNPPTHTPGIQTPARKGLDFPKPEWADPVSWRDFLQNRKRKSLPNTPSAYKRFLDDIARLADEEWPPGRLLDHAAGKGWASINDPRTDRKPGNDNRNQRPQSTGSTATAAAGALAILEGRNAAAGH